MNSIIRQIEMEEAKRELPEFGPGDTIRLLVQYAEAGKKKTQRVEGIVVKLNHKNRNRSATVRSILSGVGVERTYQLDSPLIESIEVLRRGKVRRARLYYLRSKVGKGTRVKEKRRELAGVEQ